MQDPSEDRILLAHVRSILEGAVSVASAALRASGASAVWPGGGAPEGAALRVVHATGVDAAPGAGGEPPWARVMASGAPERARLPAGGGAWLGVPVRDAAGRVRGVLSVTGPAERTWTDGDASLLARVAAGAAAGLEACAALAEAGGERRRLAERVDLLGAFMDHSPVVAFMKNLDGRYIYANAECVRRFGIVPERGPRTRDVMPPEAAERVAAADRQVIASGTPQEFVAPIPLPDGRWRTWRIVKFPFSTAEGEVVVGGVALDVTEREAADRALLERERQLREAQAIARVSSWEWDLVRNRGSWSDEHFRLFGLEPGSMEVTEEAVRARIHPDDHAAHDAAVQAALAGERPLDVRLRVLRPDGETVHLHVRGEVERDAGGTPVRLVGTAQDVTELETVARALRASEERYRRLVEGAGDIIYETDAEGRFTYANPATLRILGYRTEEVVGRRYTELMRADYQPVAAEFYARQVQEGREGSYFEFPAVGRGGAEIWLGQVVQLVREGERVAGFHAVARDITAQREVDRLKGEFVSVVSHELRTPLTSIRGSLGLLASGKLGEVPPRAVRMVEIAIQNTDRLIRLINDILDVERLESGLVRLSRGTVPVAELLDGAASALGGFAESAAVTLDLRPPPPGLAVHGDPDRLVQVLTNLMSNAVKFSPRGGTVRVHVERAGGGAEFRVTDEGSGIPARELERVFARFQQVDSSDTREKGGTGLGLAIARAIVEQHGGRIWVESTVGEGSTFHFTVPVDPEAGGAPADARREPSDEPGPPPPVREGARRVLVVEDDVDLAQTIAASLADLAEVEVAATAGDAVRRARASVPDLIVLDVGLDTPDGGYRVVDALREHPALRRVALVVYTAGDLAEGDRGRLALGETRWLMKGRTPPEQLVREVCVLLQRGAC